MVYTIEHKERGSEPANKNREVNTMTQIRTDEYETTRNNVTLAQFLAYVNANLTKKGINFGVDSTADCKAEMQRQENERQAARWRRNATYDFRNWIYENYKDSSDPYMAYASDKNNHGYVEGGRLYIHYGLNENRTNWIQVIQFDIDENNRGTGYYYQAACEYAE